MVIDLDLGVILFWRRQYWKLQGTCMLDHLIVLKDCEFDTGVRIVFEIHDHGQFVENKA